MALALTAPADPPPFRGFLGAKEPNLCLAAAAGVLLSETNDVDAALAVFLEPLRDGDRFKVDDSTWLFGDSEVPDFVVQLAPHINSAGTALLRAQLPTLLPKLDVWEASSLGANLMHLGFETEHLPRSTADLDPLQRALLSALTRPSRTWPTPTRSSRAC